MFDSVFMSILVCLGLPTFLLLFILVTPSKQKWVLEARYEILFGPKERQERLLHMLKEKLKKLRRP